MNVTRVFILAMLACLWAGQAEDERQKRLSGDRRENRERRVQMERDRDGRRPQHDGERRIDRERETRLSRPGGEEPHHDSHVRRDGETRVVIVNGDRREEIIEEVFGDGHHEIRRHIVVKENAPSRDPRDGRDVDHRGSDGQREWRSRFAEMTEGVKKRHARLEKAEAELADKHEHIDRARQELAEREENLERERHEFERDREALENERRELEQAREEIHQTERHLEALSHELEDREQHLAEKSEERHHNAQASARKQAGRRGQFRRSGGRMMRPMMRMQGRTYPGFPSMIPPSEIRKQMMSGGAKGVPAAIEKQLQELRQRLERQEKMLKELAGALKKKKG